MIARFGAIPFSRYRIVQGTHLNSPPLHHQPSLLAMVGALRRILVELGAQFESSTSLGLNAERSRSVEIRVPALLTARRSLKKSLLSRTGFSGISEIANTNRLSETHGGLPNER
ncbi:hypothetical protein CKA32_004202 [Geitlerinema sp. FC II]|nr:hypothetical protein CKA32_004202 [Geitlerinema sp. FC II]